MFSSLFPLSYELGTLSNQFIKDMFLWVVDGPCLPTGASYHGYLNLNQMQPFRFICFSISLFPSFSILWLFAKRVELELLSLPKLVTFQVPDQALCHPEGLYCTLDRSYFSSGELSDLFMPPGCQRLFQSFINYFLSGKISCMPGWPWTLFVAEDYLVLLILLSLSPRCWSYRSTLFAHTEDWTRNSYMQALCQLSYIPDPSVYFFWIMIIMPDRSMSREERFTLVQGLPGFSPSWWTRHSKPVQFVAADTWDAGSSW